MALPPLSEVFLLLMIGVLLGGLGVGLPARLTLSGGRGIVGIIVGGVRTGMIGSFLCGFLGVGILGILWGSTTRLFDGDIVCIAIKFVNCFHFYWLSANISY